MVMRSRCFSHSERQALFHTFCGLSSNTSVRAFLSLLRLCELDRKDLLPKERLPGLSFASSGRVRCRSNPTHRNLLASGGPFHGRVEIFLFAQRVAEEIRLSVSTVLFCF